jgi:hypothetical protein
MVEGLPRVPIMHLFELTDSRAAAPAAGERVPEWTLGCFRRRSITFFTGAEDDQTEVLWLQSRGLTADFRRSPGLARVATLAALGELPLAELLALARVEGGFARTRWDGALMYWSSWHSFQTHAKWPEPGRLERVGSSLVEFAPSGAYVEDWRFQPCGSGPLIGLSLLDERDARSGQMLHRGGGLIVCGRHAAFVRGRPEALPEGGRIDDYLRASAGDPATLERVFAFDASYGTTETGRDDFTVRLSTLPWREGEPLLSLEGFSRAGDDATLLQRVEEQGRIIERRFTIDTLEREFSGAPRTSASGAAEEWWRLEGDALFATVR